MENNEVVLTIVENTCIYLDGTRIQGRKPFISEMLPQKHIKIKLKNLLDSIDREDIEEYLTKTK